MKQRSRNILWRLLIISSTFIFIIGFCLLSGNLLIVNDNQLQESDVIIALGFPAQDDGKPSSTMKARVEKAVELFNKGYAPILIFSGADVGNKFVEAEVMAKYAESLGVSKEAILMETEAQNTIQNVNNSVKIMHENNWDTAIIVTSPYHTQRASNLFSEIDDIEISVVAAKYPPELGWYHRIRQILHEYALILWHKIGNQS